MLLWKKCPSGLELWRLVKHWLFLSSVDHSFIDWEWGYDLDTWDIRQEEELTHEVIKKRIIEINSVNTNANLAVFNWCTPFQSGNFSQYSHLAGAIWQAYKELGFKEKWPWYTINAYKTNQVLQRHMVAGVDFSFVAYLGTSQLLLTHDRRWPNSKGVRPGHFCEPPGTASYSDG